MIYKYQNFEPILSLSHLLYYFGYIWRNNALFTLLKIIISQ